MSNEGNIWSRNLTFFRQRIIQTHVRYLKVPQGNLVSSMMIGRRGVDLDFELQDSFRLAGLAHTLAASGFHVSILFGLLLYLTKSVSSSRRLLVVTVCLFIYAAIAGFYPSILRACLMGFGVVVGMVYDRSVKVYGSLLLVGVTLLLINPIWIWDLGFQLSFLATWGVIVLLPAIVDGLDWMPPTVANLVAVPLAATIWTLPLQSYVFHYLPLYGILTNIIATPFVLVITIGGFISGFLGLFIPLVGSAIAYILFVPILVLIKIVEISNNLPFSYLTVGEITLIQLLIIYFIFTLICISKTIQKYWLVISIATLISVIIPLVSQKLNLVQVTLLSNSYTPTIIVQNHNQNTLINLGNKENIKFNVLPFLRSQGINQINLLLADEEQNKNIDGSILNRLNINQTNQQVNDIKTFNKNIWFNLDRQKWLIVNQNDHNLMEKNSDINVLIWNDKAINYELIKKFAPEIMITNLVIRNNKFLEYLLSHNIELLSTRNNTIQWQEKLGFRKYN